MNLKTIARGAAIALIPVAGFLAWNTMASAEGLLPVAAPAPALDETSTATTATAVFAGGCFWGVQAVYQHIDGVLSAVSGYSGGAADTAHYNMIGTGTTGHAEAVEVVYDPPGDLIWRDPPDLFLGGAQPDQAEPAGAGRRHAATGRMSTSRPTSRRQVTDAYIAQLDAAGVYPAKIVTEVTPYTNFYNAEDYHQDNAYTMNVNPGYLADFDLPKIEDFKTNFSTLWVEKPGPGVRHQLRELKTAFPLSRLRERVARSAG